MTMMTNILTVRGKCNVLLDQEIVFLVGDYLYSRSYDADKSIRSGEMFPDQIVEEDLSFITREEVREMREQKGILSITRNRK